jgi:hypothetical protein
VTRTLALLLLLLAAAAAILRFGQRENESAAVSDSDYYLDMAAVFAGEKPAFDADWSAAGHSGAHHYARPLLPFLAGWAARAIPGLGARAAFSLIDVLGAWVVAALLFGLLRRAGPELRHPWLPPALFLTGFPQVNWGYHVLTDTLGYATAFAASVAVWSAVRARRSRGGGSSGSAAPWLTAVFALQALAFLARETAWIVPVLVVWLIVDDHELRADRGFAAALLLTVLLAALPWLAYLRSTDVRPIGIAVDPAAWLAPGYALDFLVKSAVAFHVAWALAAVGARGSGLATAPRLLVGWALGALLYMGAGYAHNSLAGVGYPLRLTWALFPLVLFLAAWGLERVPRGGDVRMALALLALNALIGVGGTLLDPGTSGLTAPGLIAP